MHMQPRPSASASSLFALLGAGTPRQPFVMRSFFFLLLLSLLLVSHGSTAVITGACERDSQCGAAMCCAVSLWIRSLRMCTPMGQEGDDCHPLSQKVRGHSCVHAPAGRTPTTCQVPFFGKRLHHTCPCLPNLSCITIDEGKSKCLSHYKYPDYYL